MRRDVPQLCELRATNKQKHTFSTSTLGVWARVLCENVLIKIRTSSESSKTLQVILHLLYTHNQGIAFLRAFYLK